MPNDPVQIDGQRLWQTIGRSSEIGPGRPGGLHRLALSDADRDMRDQFAAWCADTGLPVSVDAAGNMFARMGGREDLPPVTIGSHFDTTAAGGRFDGVLGVLAGLEIVRTLKDQGIVPRRPIEVINWTNEEGTRFAPPMAASSVFAGKQSLEWLHGLKDDDGISFGDELTRTGYDGPAPVGGRPLDSYFELHIEQGPELHAKGLPLGIVTGGYSSYGMNVVFRGRTAHSGPTQMEVRQNALVGAAKFIAAINDIGWAFAPVGKTTAPRIQVWPNKPGIIPDHAEATVDMRHADPDTTEEMVRQAHAALATAAKEANVTAEIVTEWRFGTERFSDDLIGLVRHTARSMGVEPLDMLSQAGHDAYHLSAVTPTVLLFSPCIDGISHNEAEDVEYAPTITAVNVLLQAALARADRPD
ncbi:MAG: Zn-dependent hydrolase [Pseudomonadota bacterium]